MVFAVLPLSRVGFGVLSAFPVFDKWSDTLSSYIFSNFVPASASAIEGHLRDLSRNTGQLTTVGVIALVVSLLVTLVSIEARSEEHTSELQSLMRISYAVFCLKKKNNTKPNTQDNI